MAEAAPYFGCPISFIPGTHGLTGNVNVYGNVNFTVEIHPSSVSDAVLNGVSYCTCVVDQYGENCKCVDVYGSLIVRSALHATLMWFKDDNILYGMVPFHVKFICGGVCKEFYFDPRFHHTYGCTCDNLSGLVCFAWDEMTMYESEAQVNDDIADIFHSSETESAGSESDESVSKKINNLSVHDDDDDYVGAY